MTDVIPEGWQEIAATSNFTDLVGPICRRVEDDGTVLFGMRITDKHLNKRDVAHGGVLMTLMDNLLGRMIREVSGEENLATATIELDNKFIGSVRKNDFVIGRGEVVRRTRSLVFLQGTLTVDDQTVFTASGVWKLLGK